MPLPAFIRRLRESVSATTEPQLQRDRADPTRESAPTQAERDAAVASDDAFPDGSFPIKTQKQADDAWDLRGHDENHSTDSIVAHIRKQVAKHKLTMPGDKPARESVAFHVRLREATLTKSEDGVYEATVISEGPGNPEDDNYYTSAALREAVNAGLFEGLRAYANHPSATEVQDRPERDVKQLVGHFKEARFIDGSPAEVRAKFVPIRGSGYEWVTSLVEAAIQSLPGKPLIGISIDGYGYTPDTQTIGGRTYSMVREFVQLGSADLVTQTATGGRFHRRLREALNPRPRPDGGGHDPGGRKMKPAELQEKVKAAVAKLSEASGLDESKATEANAMVTEAITSLRECETATIDPVVKIEEKRVEVPVAATEAEKDQLAVKLREAAATIEANATALAESKKRADDAETKLQEAATAKLAAKVLREAEAPAKSAKSWFADVAACDDEATMKALVEAKMAEREEILTEVRESYGLIEGAGRRPPTTHAGTSTDLLDTLGLDRDEYVPAA